MSDSDSIPTDINELSNLVIEQRTKLAHQSLFIEQLLEQIKLARHHRFGVKSEYISPDQLRLLLEEEQELTEQEQNEPADPAPVSPRRKRGRRQLPDHLPRIEIEYTLDKDACRCEHCQAHMEPLSQKITEQLDIVPAQVPVIRHLRQTYRCTRCEQSMVTTPMPPQPIPKSNATPGTLTYLIIAKYLEGMPLYR